VPDGIPYNVDGDENRERSDIGMMYMKVLGKYVDNIHLIL